MNKITFILITLLLIVAMSATTMAATKTTAAAGGWNVAATWGGTIPAAGDSCIINHAVTLTATPTNVPGAVNVNTGSITWSTGITLTVTGNGSTSFGTFGGSGTCTLSGNVNLTLTNGSYTFSGTLSNANRLTVTFNGSTDQTIFSGATATWRQITINKSGGTLFIGKTLTISNTTTLTAGNINYNGAAQTMLTATHPGNVTLSGSGVKTTGVTVNGILSMEGTATVSAAPTYGTAATLQYNTATARTAGAEWITPFAATGGVIIANTGTITMNAAKIFNASVPLTINNGATLATNNLALTLGGNFTNNGTFNAGTGTVTFSGTTAAIAGNGTGNFYIITLPTGTNTLTINTSVVCTTFTMPQNTGTGAMNTVNISGTNTLTVLGALTINRIAAFNVNAGTLNAASIDITGGTAANVASLNVTTGTVTVTGNITFSGTIGSIQSINFTGSGTLNVGGTFEADGALTAGTGTVNFTGTNQTIPPYTYDNLTVSGSGTVNLTGITVNGTVTVTGTATVTLPPTPISGLTVNTSNGMTLSSATTVNDTLKFLLGNLLIGNNNLTLGSTATVIGAADGKCVVTNGTGVVSKVIAAAGNFTFPVGISTRYNPVAFTSPLGGTYTAAIVTGESPVTANNAASCMRTWTITGTNPANVTFTWNKTDAGASINSTSCTAWRYNGSAWTEMGGVTTGSDPTYTTTLSNVTSFSPWTIGNSGLLPVEMTSFTAVLQGTSALLKWATATETNNSGFQIERSIEGSSVWAEVAFVKGAGTSSSPKTYSYEDKNLAPGKYVYRIKQIDNDGTTTIYNPNALPRVDAGASNALQLGGNYPNPFNPTTNIQFSVPQDGYASLKVYNMIGQEVATLFSGMAKAGHYIPATFNASRLASGIYFARLQYSGKSLVQRMLLAK